MSRRVTISMDADLDKKIRARQAKNIKTTPKFVSYSSTVNELIRIGFHNV